MPVLKCPNKKFKIGHGQCMYDSKAKAERAYRGYLGAKYGRKMIKGVDMETNLNFFVPIEKVDEDLRMVYGVATCENLDKQNEIVDYAATKEALNDYSEWRNIREMHKPSAVGVAPILELRDDKKELFIGAKIVDDQAWAKCKEGVYKGFSIGGEVLDRRVEVNKSTGKPLNRVTKYVLNEISIVDRPANPACKFSAIKRDTSIETVTIPEDPLQTESVRVMEKAIMLSKRILTKEDLTRLPDEAFGLIKVVSDGDKLVKHRLYPMPDKVHAVNMIKKMVGAEELSSDDKERIHQTALLALGKSHKDSECPYCINQKLSQGGADVNKPVAKAGSVVITHEPDRKTVEVKDGESGADTVAGKPSVEAHTDAKATAPVAKPPVAASVTPAEEQKPHIAVDEEVGDAGAAPAGDSDSKLDRILSILESLLGEEQGEEEMPEGEEVGYEDEAAVTVAEDEDEEPAKVTVAEAGEEEDENDEPGKVDMKPAGEEEEDEACKVAKVKKVVKVVKKGLYAMKLAKIEKGMSALVKENRALRVELEKVKKAPLPRKDGLAKADGTKPEKVEKYQDAKLEKHEVIFSDDLQKDIEKAQDLRKSGKALTSDEQAFCQRVAEKMLDEKLAK